MYTPLNQTFVAKLGFEGVYNCFDPKHRFCGYSLAMPRRDGCNVNTKSMFRAKIWKISNFFLWKFSICRGSSNCWILHGRGFVMHSYCFLTTYSWLCFATGCTSPCWLLTFNFKQTQNSNNNKRKNHVLSLGYICPDHRTMFRSAIFLTIFRHRRWSWATTYVFKIHTGIVRFLYLPFVDVLIQKRKAASYGCRRSPQILSGYRTDLVRCPYGVPIRSDTNARRPYGSRRVSADLKWKSYSLPWSYDANFCIFVQSP